MEKDDLIVMTTEEKVLGYDGSYSFYGYNLSKLKTVSDETLVAMQDNLKDFLATYMSTDASDEESDDDELAQTASPFWKPPVDHNS